MGRLAFFSSAITLALTSGSLKSPQVIAPLNSPIPLDGSKVGFPFGSMIASSLSIGSIPNSGPPNLAAIGSMPVEP